MSESRNEQLVKVEITWSKRVAKVTSLTGGHVATCLDLGDRMELIISGKRPREANQSGTSNSRTRRAR